jgi:hypothetical protein
MLNASLMRLLSISKLVICGSTQNFFDLLTMSLDDDDEDLLLQDVDDLGELFSLVELSFTLIRTQSGGRSLENMSNEVLLCR